ncbi:MAG: hypothetical protein LBJ72_07230 [Dysgonamonadaceae bacterium]|jgi:hypothetical protein|nr:hypothetical protein [Dysgonamonadaceae bacterium]
MANKIITEDDFFQCSGGMMPSPFQSKQLIVKKTDSAKYITKMDISTLSWVDFGCKKVMLLYAVVAAVAALVAALCVATGGAALIAICAIAGAAGAALGAVIGTLICGQLVAPTRKWLGSKSNFQILGIDTITGDHYMECDAFVMLGMSPEFITFAPNIKSWGQAIASGVANFIGKIFEGMMAGALIGTTGAALSGLAGAGITGGWSGVGRAVLQFAKSMPKNFVGNIVESFSGFGLGMRGVMAGQNVLATYGETGEMSAETFDKAVSDGFWSMETGSVESVKNIFSGQGTWQDYGGVVLMFSPVGEGKKELEDSLFGKTDDLANRADDADISGKVDDADGQTKDGEDVTVRRQADAEAPKKEGGSDAYEMGKSKNPEQLIQEQRVADVENGTTLLEGYGEKKGNYTRKGNYGEMKTDIYMENITELNGKDVEIRRISEDRVVDVDQKGHQGIDGVYENTNPPPKYIIVESKYGSSDLNPNTSDGPQMSDPWVDRRLDDAVGEVKADEIRTNLGGYERVLSQIDKNTGEVTLSRIDTGGNVTGQWP